MKWDALGDLVLRSPSPSAHLTSLARSAEAGAGVRLAADSDAYTRLPDSYLGPSPLVLGCFLLFCFCVSLSSACCTGSWGCSLPLMLLSPQFISYHYHYHYSPLLSPALSITDRITLRPRLTDLIS